MSHKKEHIDVLLRWCLEGRQGAQVEVYNRYYKAMYNTSLRIVKDSMEAEDVMQESFLSAFTKLDSYKAEVSFGAWLKRIVVNNSIQHYRKQQKNNTFDINEVVYKVEDSDGVDLNDGSTEQKAQKVLETMKKLKDSYRIALTLFLIEGYDYEEVGQIMNMSYASCRTTISRAKESLRQKILIEQ